MNASWCCRRCGRTLQPWRLQAMLGTPNGSCTHCRQSTVTAGASLLEDRAFVLEAVQLHGVALEHAPRFHGDEAQPCGGPGGGFGRAVHPSCPHHGSTRHIHGLPASCSFAQTCEVAQKYGASPDRKLLCMGSLLVLKLCDSRMACETSEILLCKRSRQQAGSGMRPIPSPSYFMRL